ncbi:molybdenum ABC transporter ATP-binding protein [Henriciella sp.]|uniref:molybdenum ABC transporter ATP-binding protein n=1 Tax=Henriciella sp. TaxID=1968823 RepID=UPI00261CF802|nr:molybdenum ABC transporter ATP-binding protein [Henriciella sp.]
MSAPADPLVLRVALARSGFELHVDEAVPLDGITAVFGPSGSGKTTLLRAIAGLDRPDRGRIALGSEVWFSSDERRNVPPHRRAVGYMFQAARLFSHLDVRGNLVFAERRSRMAQSDITFDDVVEATGIAGLLDRRIDRLSGGECQRVSMARTLLSRPRLLLLDEPLTGLDRASKRELLSYLRDVPARFGLPTLYVSHDIEEVSALATHMLVLENGAVTANGAISEVMQTLDLAPLMANGMTGSLIETRVLGHDAALGVTRLDLAGTSISLPLDERLVVGSTVRLFVDSRDVAVATHKPEGLSIRNMLPGRITAISAEAKAPHADIDLQVGPNRLRARITRAALAELQLAEGMEVFALIKSMSLAGDLGAS